jgi:hypothetical protein
MMTSKKRSSSGPLQETYDSIKGEHSVSVVSTHAGIAQLHSFWSTEFLIKVKDIKNRKSDIVDDLRQLAVLAEKFTELRPKSQKSWIHLAEVLDREGD